MSRSVIQSSRFKKDYKRVQSNKAIVFKLRQVVAYLAADKPLDPSCRDHELGNNWSGFRDCHIRPDLVLIYQKTDPKSGSCASSVSDHTPSSSDDPQNWRQLTILKPCDRLCGMSAQYTYWQDPSDGMWLGYWNEYPNYQTQGHTLAELQFMLRDIREAIRDGDLADTRLNVGEMEFS